jgi:hypothetical protein
VAQRFGDSTALISMAAGIAAGKALLYLYLPARWRTNDLGDATQDTEPTRPKGRSAAGDLQMFQISANATVETAMAACRSGRPNI